MTPEPVKNKRMSDDAFNRWVKLIERLGISTALIVFMAWCLLEAAKWAAPMIEENVRNSNAVLKSTAETNVKNSETYKKQTEVMERQAETLDALKEINENGNKTNQETNRTVISIETIVTTLKKHLEAMGMP